MPQSPDWNKYLDAGAEFVAMTRAQARQRAKELVGQGQLAQEQVQAFVDDLVDGVRKEIQRQVKTLGIATKEDLARIEARLAKIAGAEKSSKSATKKPAKAASKKKSAKKTTTKKKSAKKTTTKKKSAKKTTKKTTKKQAGKQRPRRAASKAAAS